MNRIGRPLIVIKRAPTVSHAMKQVTSVVVRQSQFDIGQDVYQANILKQTRKTYKEMGKSRLSLYVTLSAHVGYCVAPGVHFNFADFAFLTAGVWSCALSANTWNQLQEGVYDARQLNKFSKSSSKKQLRPPVIGSVTNKQAVQFGLWSGALGVGALSMLNPTTALLGAANIVLYGKYYTRSKRHTWLNTQLGSLVGAIPPMMGVTAGLGMSGLLTQEGWLMAGLLLFWQFPHFYALSAMTWPGYAQARYHMLPLSNPVAAAWWSLLSAFAMIAIHYYIHEYMSDEKISCISDFGGFFGVCVLLSLGAQFGLSLAFLRGAMLGGISKKIVTWLFLSTLFYIVALIANQPNWYNSFMRGIYKGEELILDRV